MLPLLNLNQKLTTFLFFLIFFLIGIFLFQDYGISIDEDNTRIVGFLSLEYIFKIFFPEHVSLIKETISDQRGAHSGFETSGVIFDLPMAFLELIFQIDDSKQYYMLRHFFNFFLFFISVYFFFLLVKNRYNSWTFGILGSLFLIMSPRIFANSFYNNKDVVFMSLFIISLYAAINFLEKQNYKNALIFSLLSAMLINVRILGLFLPPLIFLIYIINILRDQNYKKEIILPLILFLILTSLFTVLFWPYLWENPIEHFLFSVKTLSSHNLNFYTYYLGQYFFSTDPPWHYSLVWIFISTPFLYITLFIIGFFFIAQRTTRRLLRIDKNNSYIDLWRGKKELQDLIFFLTFLIPLIIVIDSGSVSYDGWRHLYFIYPSLLLIAMLGIHLIMITFFKKKKNYLFIISFILILPTIFWMYKNHPFQNVYFNFLAGKNYNEKFEMDFSGVSNNKVLQYISENEVGKTKIYSLSTTDLNLSKKILKKEIRETIEIVHDINSANYITNNYRDWRGNLDPRKINIPKGFKILYEIKVDDVAINSIYKKM